MASDVNILRQEVQQNINNFRTNINVENRETADSLHVLEININATYDKLSEENYYIATVQLDQVGKHII